MLSWQLRNLLIGVATLSVLLGAARSVRAQNYDGTWTGSYSCPPLPSGDKSGFPRAVTAMITQNQFLLEDDIPNQKQTLQGTVQPDGTITVSGEGRRLDFQNSWKLAFSGKVSSPMTMTLRGAQNHRSPCVIVLTNTRPAPKSLAGLAEAKVVPLSKPKEVPADALSIDDRLLDSLPNPEQPYVEVWKHWVESMPLQEKQFCEVVDNFNNDLAKARQDRNGIEWDDLHRRRGEDLSNLLPGGLIQNWVVHYLEVKIAPDGSAAVRFQPPCKALIGSNSCEGDQKENRGMIGAGSPIYRELAKLESDSFVTVTGTLPAIGERLPGPLPSYLNPEPGTYCKADETGKQEELFVIKLGSLFTLVQ